MSLSLSTSIDKKYSKSAKSFIPLKLKLKSAIFNYKDLINQSLLETKNILQNNSKIYNPIIKEFLDKLSSLLNFIIDINYSINKIIIETGNEPSTFKSTFSYHLNNLLNPISSIIKKPINNNEICKQTSFTLTTPNQKQPVKISKPNIIQIKKRNNFKKSSNTSMESINFTHTKCISQITNQKKLKDFSHLNNYNHNIFLRNTVKKHKKSESTKEINVSSLNMSINQTHRSTKEVTKKYYLNNSKFIKDLERKNKLKKRNEIFFDNMSHNTNITVNTLYKQKKNNLMRANKLSLNNSSMYSNRLIKNNRSLCDDSLHQFLTNNKEYNKEISPRSRSKDSRKNNNVSSDKKSKYIYFNYKTEEESGKIIATNMIDPKLLKKRMNGGYSNDHCNKEGEDNYKFNELNVIKVLNQQVPKKSAYSNYLLSKSKNLIDAYLKFEEEKDK